MKEYLELLTRNGYVPTDQTKDFGSELHNVHYLIKKRATSWEYVSLVFYEDKFCEAVYELYMAEKNTRRAKGTPKASEFAKKGYNTLLASLPRTMTDLTTTVTKTDEQINEEVTRLYNMLLEGEKKK
jgi:hypothetical protein